MTRERVLTRYHGNSGRAHNFALRVGADASRGEKGLKTVRERPVGADDSVAAWHGSTCLRDCLYLPVLYDTRGCLEASEKRALSQFLLELVTLSCTMRQA